MIWHQFASRRTVAKGATSAMWRPFAHRRARQLLIGAHAGASPKVDRLTAMRTAAVNPAPKIRANVTTPDAIASPMPASREPER